MCGTRSAKTTGIAIDMTRSPGFSASCCTRRCAIAEESRVRRGWASTVTVVSVSMRAGSRFMSGRISDNPPVTGTEALAAGAWADARQAFEAALAIQDTPEALDGLGLAAWWLDEADLVFESRERAYKLYLDRDDRRAAARLGVWLAWDCWAFRGETAVASGWLQRARRLLDALPESPELAWLEARESQLALAEDGDPDPRPPHATEE